MRLALPSLVLSLSLAACGGTDTSGNDAGAQTRTDKIVALTGSVSAGELVYQNNGCSGCHGAKGLGTASGPTLDEPLKNDGKAEIVEVLLDGVKGNAMASYASLSDQQIADLYAYMKSTFGK
jgi:cytochrome c oxidase subunit 2